MKLNSKIPDGQLEEKWRNYQLKSQLINPANKKKLNVIVVGSGLAGAGAASTLAELGYDVQCFCYQDSARRGTLRSSTRRHQCGKKLPARWGQCLENVLRHA